MWLLDLGQKLGELGIVHLYAVIQIQRQAHIGVMVDDLLVLAHFDQLLLQLLRALDGSGTHAAIAGFRRALGVLQLHAQTILQFVHVIRTDAGDGVLIVAVQVGQALEAVLLAGVKLPVDGALLIGAQVIGIEILQIVVAQNLLGA